jgi:hypothetical protein
MLVGTRTESPSIFGYRISQGWRILPAGGVCQQA